MTERTKVENIQFRLSRTKNELEKVQLLSDLSLEYKKMWKLRQALEASQEGLRISQAILVSIRPTKHRTIHSKTLIQYTIDL